MYEEIGNCPLHTMALIGSASESRDFARFGPGGSTLTVVRLMKPTAVHPVWPPPPPPPKRPDQINTFCMVSRASTDLIFCIHRDFDVRNNVCKPRRLVCKCCRDISAWKSRVMKPSLLRDPSRMKPIEYRDEANWFSNWADEANCW